MAIRTQLTDPRLISMVTAQAELSPQLFGHRVEWTEALAQDLAVSDAELIIA